ncbi:MAG TPA: Rid family detoxifying hydrolase [Gaiellaceae bacterium]|nr:Rid family detoxifying hydrolase [Gaiellaceae bacterium]
MSKRVVHTEKAPAPFQGAPYSQGIVHGDLVFVAGQVGLDPETNQVVGGGIEAQTEQAMKNMSAVLEAAGSSLENVLKTSIFLVDFGDFPAMNEVYARFVGPDFPARATVQIAGLPMGALVEIEVVAHT